MEDYYFNINGKQVGPMMRESIIEHMNKGLIDTETMAWAQGMNDWKPVRHIEELNNLLIPPGPPPLTEEAVKAALEPPAELSPVQKIAFRFVLNIYRPLGKRIVPVRQYVLREPKKAVPVLLGTIVVLLTAVALLVNVLFE